VRHRPGGLVGVCLERSIEACVSLLAILKAGAAYVPLDPAYPPSRLAYMLADCAAPVLVTREHLRDRLAVGTATVIDLDADHAAIGREPLATPDDGAGPQDLAYIIYTSGSTGKPKGVQAAHEASVNRFTWMWRRWPFTPHDVCCQKTSLSFVDSVWEIFGPLLQGVPTVIVPDEVVGDPVRLVDLLATHRVTRIVLVPSMLRHLLDTVPDRRVPSARSAVLGDQRRGHTGRCGAALRRAPARGDAREPVRILGGHGRRVRLRRHRRRRPASASRSAGRSPTHASTCSTRTRTRSRSACRVRSTSAGPASREGTCTTPSSRQGSSFPIRSPATRRRGSIGPVTSDGSAPTQPGIPRARDNQVKLRGVRIELGEIESVLRTHPSVRDAVALVSEVGGEARLIAYVVPDGRRPESSDLRRFARERLPDHTVPSAFIFLDALPMTPSGKLDRRALLSLAPTPAEGARAYVAPRTATEDALATIMAEVLKLDRVGIHDDFFELGGHSLLAVQVIARVRKILHVELPMRSLFTEPTVAASVPEIERARASGVCPGDAAPHPRLRQPRTASGPADRPLRCRGRGLARSPRFPQARGTRDRDLLGHP
jgi:acyl carrier protein